ncbi:MAG: hypothetical protein KC431_26185, partial [Myxococcales bacterium]|nr:hypothetical protein [Myxococcales bacterium]
MELTQADTGEHARPAADVVLESPLQRLEQRRAGAIVIEAVFTGERTQVGQPTLAYLVPGNVLEPPQTFFQLGIPLLRLVAALRRGIESSLLVNEHLAQLQVLLQLQKAFMGRLQLGTFSQPLQDCAHLSNVMTLDQTDNPLGFLSTKDSRHTADVPCQLNLVLRQGLAETCNFGVQSSIHRFHIVAAHLRPFRYDQWFFTAQFSRDIIEQPTDGLSLCSVGNHARERA